MTRMISRRRFVRISAAATSPLDCGGQCKGVVFRIDRDRVAHGLRKLVRREMSVNPPSQVPRWITAVTQKGEVKARAFVSNPKGPDYVGGLTIELGR